MADNKNSFVLKNKFGLPILFWLAGVCYLVPFIAYGINFFGFEISKATANWGEFGDFFGGIINPTIGLITIWFLAASLKHSTDAHSIQMSHAEKVKDFEVCIALISFYMESGHQKSELAQTFYGEQRATSLSRAAELKGEAEYFFDLAEEMRSILRKEHLLLTEKYLT